MAKNELTDKEKKSLQEYLDKVDALKKKEPPRIEDTLTQKEYDEIWAYIESGKNPPACVDRITISEITDPDGTKHKTFYDTEWEKWHADVNALHEKYHDEITHALFVCFDDWRGDPQTMAQVLRALIDGDAETPVKPQLISAVRNLMKEDYIPVLYGELTNILYGVAPKQFTQDPFTKLAYYEKDGMRIEVEGGIDSLTTSALKLLDAIIAYFTFNNPYGIKHGINTSVEIPLVEYATARKIRVTPRKMDTPEEQKKENKNASNRKRAFKRDIERDLDAIAKFRITARIKKGRNAGDYDKITLISASHAIVGDIIRVTLSPKIAQYLANSYVMSYDPALQGLDDRNPNLYRIGRKLTIQRSIDRNIIAGTANTIKVKTIIASAPHIDDLETLQKRNQRNWKEKQKKPVETVLKNLAEAEHWKGWYYIDPRTKETYTPETAETLTAPTYNNLNVVFEPPKNPHLEKRTQKLLAPAFDDETPQKEEG